MEAQQQETPRIFRNALAKSDEDLLKRLNQLSQQLFVVLGGILLVGNSLDFFNNNPFVTVVLFLSIFVTYLTMLVTTFVRKRPTQVAVESVIIFFGYALVTTSLMVVVSSLLTGFVAGLWIFSIFVSVYLSWEDLMFEVRSLNRMIALNIARVFRRA